MTNPTDTNQASEDELRESIDTLLERWRNILTHKGDGSGDEYYQSEVVDDIQEIIRTEKLKLLAEVKVQAGEYELNMHGFYDKDVSDQITAVPLEVLIKMEAGL